MAARTQPYRLDLGRIGTLEDLQVRLPEIVTNADQMFQELYEDLAAAEDSSSGGSGVDTIVNDTNVTGVISDTTLTLGWTGTLSVARGGTGRATATAYAVLCGGTTATGAHQSIASVGTAGHVLTSNGAAALPTFQPAGSPSGAALTKTNDTNVTLTLGGSPTTALLAAASLTLGWTGTLAVTRGGTGLATVAQGDLLYGSAANTLSALAKDTNATRYLSNTGGSNNPAWAQVDLTTGVTGLLPATNGGTDGSLGILKIATSSFNMATFNTSNVTPITLVAGQGVGFRIQPIMLSINRVISVAASGSGGNGTVRYATDLTSLVTTAVSLNGNSITTGTISTYNPVSIANATGLGSNKAVELIFAAGTTGGTGTFAWAMLYVVLPTP